MEKRLHFQNKFWVEYWIARSVFLQRTPFMKKMKKKKLASMYGDPKKITRGDIITAAKMKKKKKGKK